MNKQCPECKKQGHDTKGDHLWLMSDELFWTCQRAEYHESGTNYYEPVSGRQKEVTEVVDEVFSFESNEYVGKLPQGPQWLRNVEPATLQKYGVHYECNGDGTPSKHYYPIHNKSGELLGYEVRVCEPKSFYKTCKVKPGTSMLGGQLTVPNKPEHLVITEGFIDAMTMDQALRKAGVTGAHVVSLINGANLSSIRDNVDFLKTAYNVYLYADQDEPGQKIVRDVAMLLPSIRIIKTSEKDADEMVTKGKSAELVKAFKVAERWKPSSIVDAGEAIAEALKPAEWGLSYPFKSLTDKTYGIKLKRIIGIGAGPGAGKTCFVKAIQTHLVYEHKKKIGIFALEETPGEALRELAGYVMNKPLAEPDCVYDPDELQRVLDTFKGMVTVYNPENYERWSDIEEAIRYMYSEGTQYFFIDPLSSLVENLSAADANQYLNEAMGRMKKMRQALDLTIFHVNHLNNPSGGQDHGAGGRVFASQFSGSRAMWKASTDMWGLIRNQLEDDPAKRNVSEVVSLKYRKPSKPMKFSLTYDDKTGTLSEGAIPF